MSKVTINGTTYEGDCISITNGSVTVDGVKQEGTLSGVVEIRITEGILQELNTDASVVCGDVLGDVNAGGSVSCDDVECDVHAGGSVSCGRVNGSVHAGGSVSHG